MVTHLEGPDTSAAVIIYGVNLLVRSATLGLLMFYIASERSLNRDDVATRLSGPSPPTLARDRAEHRGDRHRNRAALLAVGLYLVVTLVGLLLPLVCLQRHGR